MDGLARLSRAIHEAWRSAVTQITTRRLIALFFQAQRALELETAEAPNRQVPWCNWEAKLRLAVLGLDELHCSLFYQWIFHHFSMIFPYFFILLTISKESHRTMCFRESFNFQALRRPQESGEEAKARVRKPTNWWYEFVWITWVLLGCYMVLLLGPLKNPYFEFPSFAHILWSTLFKLEALEAFTDKLHRQLAEAG